MCKQFEIKKDTDKEEKTDSDKTENDSQKGTYNLNVFVFTHTA